MLAVSAEAQLKVLKIDPAQTAPGVTEVHGPHLAMYQTGERPAKRLVLMLVGTGGSAGAMRTIDSVMTTLGVAAISLDYPNNVISTVCAHSRDTACSDHFREEIVTGDPVSGLVSVDKANCIISRFTDLLRYLARTDPAGKWGRFLDHGKPRWDRVVVAGHSQGSGHAAYLGKLFRVNRVMILSGPQDYLADLKMPSPWLSMKSATPRNRYYAFLHVKDPFNVHYQIANCDVLMGLHEQDTVMVTPGEAVTGHPQIMVNSIATKGPHISTLNPEFKKVWAYMLDN
jgi:pimeloyl-ACP methyl ester carboxylesterase